MTTPYTKLGFDLPHRIPRAPRDYRRIHHDRHETYAEASASLDYAVELGLLTDDEVIQIRDAIYLIGIAELRSSHPACYNP